MHQEESRTDLGTVKIHKNVIASLAAIAAQDVEGVRRIGGGFKSSFFELIGKKPLLSIRVEFDKHDEVKLKIPLVIKYGFNIPEIADKVQENVRNALEKMTNLSIKVININVQGVERHTIRSKDKFSKSDRY